MKKILFICCIWVVFAGCFDDLGNYDYHEINEVTVIGLPEEMQIKYRGVDTLYATPEVIGTYDEGNQDRYYFQWKAVAKSKDGGAATSYDLGQERNLRYFVELPDNEYDVYCYVKDTITRITWKSDFKLKVTTVLGEGWMVLSDDNGVSRLDLISLSAKEEMVIRNLLKDAPVQRGPKKISMVYDMYYAQWGTEPRCYLLTESGTTKLNTQDFKWDEANELRYEMMEYPENFAPGVRTAGCGWELVISSDHVFGGTTFGPPVVFGLPANAITNTEDYFKVAEAVGTNMASYTYNVKKVLYDITNKRFVLLNNNMLGCSGMSAIAAPKFPWNLGKEFVYMTNTPYDGGSVYAIMEDLSTHKRYLCMMKIGATNGKVEQTGYIDLSGAKEISKATCFAFHPSHDWLFYGVENKIYRYDLNGQNPDPIVLEGETVTMLKFNVFVTNNVKPAMQNKLLVGSVTSGTGLNGKVRMYEIPSVFTDPIAEPAYYDNFGKPVDVTYLEK